MAKYWLVEADRTNGEGSVRAVCECHDLETEEQAKLFGAGQLRGMGYSVENVRVTEEAVLARRWEQDRGARG